MKNVVLDSSALVAYFQGERGRKAVKTCFSQARRGTSRVYMSAVNLGEVAHVAIRGRGEEGIRVFLKWISVLPVTIVAADREEAIDAAWMKHRTGLPYADCFAAALANRLEAALVTRDRDFEKAEDLVAIQWI